MKKIILTLVIIFCLTIIQSNTHANEMHKYFYDLSKQMNSVELKINFLKKALELQPTYQEALQDLKKIYQELGDKENLAKLEEQSKISTSPASSLPLVPISIAKPQESAAAPLKNETQIEAKQETIFTAGAVQQPVETKAQSAQMPDIQKVTPNQKQEISKSEISQTISAESKNLEKKIYKLTAYTFTGAALLTATTYAGYKYYEHLKREKIIDAIKKTIYYAIGAAAITTAGYYTYKYFTKPKTNTDALPIEELFKKFPTDKQPTSIETIPEPPMMLAKNSNPNQYFNINAISYEQLKSLPGCDDLNAELIVKYRSYLYSQTEKGFTSLDELYEVPLINPNVIDAIKPYLFVD